MNTETSEIYLKNKKIKRENMDEIDIILCLNKRKRNQKLKEYYRDTKKKKIIIFFLCIKNGIRSCVFWRKRHH